MNQGRNLLGWGVHSISPVEESKHKITCALNNRIINIVSKVDRSGIGKKKFKDMLIVLIEISSLCLFSSFALVKSQISFKVNYCFE